MSALLYFLPCGTIRAGMQESPALLECQAVVSVKTWAAFLLPVFELLNLRDSLACDTMLWEHTKIEKRSCFHFFVYVMIKPRIQVTR